MIVRLLVSVGALYAAVCALMFFYQRSLIYYPRPRENRGVPAMTLDVDGARLIISTGPAAGGEAVVYFGGNAEDVSWAVPELAAVFPGYAVYAMHYRGYGGSTGQPSEAALIADALALIDRVRRDHPRLTVVGRSLGAAVAVQVAAARPVERLVLMTPFYSLADVGRRHFPWVPVSWLLRDRYESFRYAPKVAAPTRILTASDDEIIANESTRMLRDCFRPGIASEKVIPGVGHNTIVLCSADLR